MSISLVQNIASSPASASPSLAFASNVTAGDLLVVAVNYSTSGDVTSVTDSQGNTYTPCGPELSSNNAGVFFGRVFMAVAGSTGANTVTSNNNASNTANIFLNEFSGVSLQDGFGNAFSAGTAVDSGGVTTRVANELLFGFYWATGSSGVQTPGTGWTALDSQGGSFHGWTEYQIVSSTGTYDTTATLSAGKSGTPSWAAVIVTFSVPTAFPNGVSVTSAIGTISTSGDGNVSASGVSASSAVGTATPNAGAVPSGVSAASALNNPTTTADASASPSGMSAASSVNAPIGSVAANVSAGVSATSSVNAPTPQVGADPLGVNTSSAVNNPATTADGNVSASGVSVASGFNAPVGQASAVPSALGATSSAHAPTTTADATAVPAGLAVTGYIGTSTGSGAANVSVTGVTSASAVHNPLINVFAVAAGLGISSTVGTATISATWTRLVADHFLTIVESLSVGGFSTAISMSATTVTVTQD